MIVKYDSLAIATGFEPISYRFGVCCFTVKLRYPIFGRRGGI